MWLYKGLGVIRRLSKSRLGECCWLSEDLEGFRFRVEVLLV